LRRGLGESGALARRELRVPVDRDPSLLAQRRLDGRRARRGRGLAQGL